MNRLRSVIRIPLIGSVLVAGLACDGGVTAPTTGTLDVSIDGFPPGYRSSDATLALVVGGENHRFLDYDPNPRLTLTGLPPGELTVALDGLPVDVPADCRPTDGTERTTTIEAGTRAYLWFDLACTWGRLRISTTTTGSDADADGYSVQLVTEACYYYYYYGDYECESTSVSVPSTGAMVATITSSMYSRSYAVAVSGLSANCTVEGPASFDYPAVAEIAFEVTCTDASGAQSGRP